MTSELIPIHIIETGGFARSNEPVRIGVPLPRGYIDSPEILVLHGPDKELFQLQARPLCYWPDTSIKWVLIDFFTTISADKTQTIHLTKKEGNTSRKTGSQPQIHIHEDTNQFYIDTGLAVFHVPKNDSSYILSSVKIDKIEHLANDGSVLRLKNSNKEELSFLPDSYLLEENGPLHSTLLISGAFKTSTGKVFINCRVRLHFFVDSSAIRLEVTIHNPRAALHPGGLWDLGDPGSIYFSDLSFILHSTESGKIEWQAEEKNEIRTTQAPYWQLYQDSSGGHNWASTNHVDHHDQLTISFCGYKVSESDKGKEKTVFEGKRATPFVRINTSSHWIAITAEEFWQNFPKAMSVKNGRELRMGIFPEEYGKKYELQCGEQKRHIFTVEFGRKNSSVKIQQSRQPVHVYVDPKWIESTKALSNFIAQHNEENTIYREYINNIIQGEHSFFNKREVIDEFGWRNFGDVYADHEAVNHKGPTPLVSHYNNQYDFIYGALVQFVATGDKCWFDLMKPLAQHVVDIDIYHTDGDKAAFNHGLFWHTDHYRDVGTCTHRGYSKKNLQFVESGSYGGGTSNEHIYTTGLTHYYYLTGDPEAKNGVIELAGYVLAMDDGSRNIFGLFDEGPTGLASQTVATNFHKPGRGAGNAINTLLDAYRLTQKFEYLAKAEQLIQRCIHPEDDIAALKLDDPEYRWSYLVFLQILAKYLDLKREFGETDYPFHYARESLLHYADWMYENEVPYKEVLHKVEIPTETWPAQDIRKACVFAFAFKYGEEEDRSKYMEKARYFFTQCLDDLLTFETAYLTRPLVLLAVYGSTNAYFDKYRLPAMKFPKNIYSFGSPVVFVPQRARFKSTFKKKLRIAGNFVKRLIATKKITFMQKFKKK